MRIKGEIFPEIKPIINRILRSQGDCESLLNKTSWYGHRLYCGPLFCCYGVIGYDICFDSYNISVDNDLGVITILDED